MAFEWKDIGTVVGQAAPVLGSVLGGIFAGGPGSNLGGAAGTAVQKLLQSLGLASDATPDQVQAAIASDPQAALKLKQAEMDFQIALGKQKLDELQAYLIDIQSARTREVETTKATGKRDVNLYALAWLIVAGFFGLTCLLIFRSLPPDASGVVFMLFGALAAAFGSVVGYFFGSSKGSADKSQFMANELTVANKK